MIVVGHDRSSGAPLVAGDEYHALFQGPPRSGKTSGFLSPSVLTHAGPVVVASSKRDLFDQTVAYRARQGPVWLFSLEPGQVPAGIMRAAWSPLPGCETWDRALQRARSLTVAEDRGGNDADRFFRSQAERALAALLHASALAGWSMEDVARWAMIGDLTEPLGILTERGAAWPAGVLRGFDEADARLRDSILVTAADTIRVYDSEFARRQADGPLIPVPEFLARNGTIYIVAPSEVQEQFASLVVGLLDNVRRATYAWHRPGRESVLMVLDEADKIAPWPRLPGVLGEGGSQGLQVCLCVQDLSQARTRWGGATDGFLTLFRHKVLLGGVADRTTLDNLAAVLGEEPVPGASSTVTRPLWPPHRLAAIPRGVAVHVDGVDAQYVRVIHHHDVGGRR